MIEIKHKDGLSILFECECEADSIKIALGLAIANHANLRGANLHGANLHDANLHDANLRHAIGVPIILTGLLYSVHINKDDTVRIGCEKRKTSEWLNYTDEEIHKMDGDDASIFWDEYKSMILSIADKYQQK